MSNFITNFYDFRGLDVKLRQQIFESLIPVLVGVGALILVVATPMLLMRNEIRMLLMLGGVYALFVVAWLARALSFQVRVWIFVLALYLAGEVVFLMYGVMGTGGFYLFSLPLLAVLLTGHMGLVVAFVLSLVMYIVNALAFTQHLVIAPPFTNDLFSWGVNGLQLVFILVVIGYVMLRYQMALVNNVIEAQKKSLESVGSVEKAEREVQQLKERVRRTEDAAAMARTFSRMRSRDELCWRAVRDISEAFGLYQVNLFLLDSRRETLALAAASSSLGVQWVREGWQIPLGDPSAPALAALVAKERMVLIEGHPRFPESKVELGLPLVVRGATLGVLDIHGSLGPFTEEQIQFFRILAEQIAASLEVARLLEEGQSRLREMRSLAVQDQGVSWGRMLEDEELLPYQLGNVPEEAVMALAEAAVKAREPKSVHLDEPEGYLLVTPLLAREFPLGFLAFYRHQEGGDWDSSTLALIQEAATYLAVALDNTRLVLESRRQALYEEQLGRFGSAIWANPQSDTIMEMSVRELGRLFGAGEVALYINPSRTSGGEG